MSHCDRCGKSGARYSPMGDRRYGKFCFDCIDFARFRLDHMRTQGYDVGTPVKSRDEICG